MTSAHRIVFNTFATYGRSVFATALGLFSARWVLQALGEADYGLYGVIGSVIVFITFLNGVLGVSLARFYAFSIGHGRNMSKEHANDDLKKWFNTALSIHLMFPFILIALGYPAGVYCIRNYLTIPSDRLVACVWVFRIALVTAFVNMSSIPFVAMYTAHQLITELAFFGMLSSLGVFFSAYLLQSVTSDRLIVYALMLMVINAGIPVLQAARACFKFEACRLNGALLFERNRLKTLFQFAGWQLFGSFGAILRGQGMAILVNLYFGPKANASYSVAHQVSAQTATLSTALTGALQPALTIEEGSGNREKTIALALQCSKFGTVLILFFAIPLILESETTLRLWLKTPPTSAHILCRFIMGSLVIDCLTSGLGQAIAAQGRIAKYQAALGSVLIFTLPLAWCFMASGGGITSVGYAFVVTMAICSLGRLYFCKVQLNLLPVQWFNKVALPVIILILISGAIGICSILCWTASFYRLCLTTGLTLVSTTCIGWFVVLTDDERRFIVNNMLKEFIKLCKQRAV